MKLRNNRHIDALDGSQRDGSHTRNALKLALSPADLSGAKPEFVDLTALESPVFDPDRNDASDAEYLRRRVEDSDEVWSGMPMYHRSYSSPLKTAPDYCGFDEFEGTTMSLLLVSGGGFPALALEHLRSVSRTLDAWHLPYQLAIPNADKAFEAGQLVNESLGERVEKLGTDLVHFAGVETSPEATSTNTVSMAD